MFLSLNVISPGWYHWHCPLELLVVMSGSADVGLYSEVQRVDVWEIYALKFWLVQGTLAASYNPSKKCYICLRETRSVIN
jgi:hypothetical protein